MKYANETGSGAMIYILDVIKIVSGIQKFIGGYTDTYREHGDVISLLPFILKIRKAC
jgi:hypothetical protein